MAKYTSCAFTGHRPQKFPWRFNESDSDCVALKAFLTEQIEKLVQAGVTEYYSGMADGSDIWLSQIVLALRKNNPALKLHCILPCNGQESRWNDSARDRYHSILKQADDTRYVSQTYYDGCMLERNRRMVNAAGILLAVYNGEWRGGTAATVRYARKLGRGILVIDPSSRSMTVEGDVPDSVR